MYRTQTGKLFNDEELNELDALQIEQLGIHSASDDWHETSTYYEYN